MNYSSNQSVAYDWKEPVRIYGYFGENKVNYLFSLRSSLRLTVFFPWKILLGRGGGGVSQCRENREEKRGVNVKEKGGKGKWQINGFKYMQKETNKAKGLPGRTC